MKAGYLSLGHETQGKGSEGSGLICTIPIRDPASEGVLTPPGLITYRNLCLSETFSLLQEDKGKENVGQGLKKETRSHQ